MRKNLKKKVKVYVVPIFIDFSLFMMNMVIVMMMIGVLMWWLLSPQKNKKQIRVVPNSTNYSFTHFFILIII